MLDNGDGAVRSGKSGFPVANIPANCSGTVAFANKESQTTLPVKSYQLVIDSCSVIEQSSGEMEMHLALIVDGYKFVETGYDFRQLPNSQSQLALPEWALESSASPVSLTSFYLDNDSYALGVLFNDGSAKVVAFEDGEHYIPVTQDGRFNLMSPESCSEGSWYSEDLDTLPSAYVDDAVAGEFGMNSCNMSGILLNCNLLLSLDELATFFISLEDVSPEESRTLRIADFAISQ